MRLIENWRQWPRMYSQWAFGAIAALQGSVLMFLAPEILAAPVLFATSLTWSQLFNSITAFLAISGFVGRLIAQDLPAPEVK